MRHIRSKHNCLAACAAMLLDFEEEQVVHLIGREWDSIKYKNGVGAGYHIQDIIILFVECGRSLITLDINPILTNGVETIPSPRNYFEIFRNILPRTRGIIITPRHAVAWDGKNVFDPARSSPSANIETYIPVEYYFEILK